MWREKPALISIHRVQKSALSDGKVHIVCKWSGNTTKASMWKGCRYFTILTATRKISTWSDNKRRWRWARLIVKNRFHLLHRHAGIAWLIIPSFLMPIFIVYIGVRRFTPTYCAESSRKSGRVYIWVAGGVSKSSVFAGEITIIIIQILKYWKYYQIYTLSDGEYR